jgi:predicted HTH transcriptional regulator
MLYARGCRVEKVMRPIWRRRYDESPFPERWDYPLEALREDIGNVIVHRDYSDPGNIQVCIFDDRPEI